MSAVSFADKISSLSTLRDSDIYVTKVARSGTRFTGFTVIDHQKLSDIFTTHGQEPVYAKENGTLVMTCYPTQEEAKTEVVSVTDLKSPPHSLSLAGDILHAGAVSRHHFALPSDGLKGSILSAVCSHPRTIKAFVQADGLVVLQAHDRQIEQGLVATLTNQRVGGAPPFSRSHVAACSMQAAPGPPQPTRRASAFTTLRPRANRCGKSSSRSSHFRTQATRRSAWKSF